VSGNETGVKAARGGLFFYRRLPSPLHATRAGVAALWTLALTAAALFIYDPLVLLALLAAIFAAAAGAGVSTELRRALRTAAIVVVPIVLINVLVSRQGLTVFARLGDLGPLGQGNLTVEAVVYGAVIALKVTIVIIIATLASLAVDPDALLRIFRRLSFRSALTASLAVRMIPLLAADAHRLAEAQRTRPRGTSKGARQGARERVALLGAIVAGSLDRALDVAATLEVRGFAAAPRATRSQRPWSRHDIAFACSSVAIVALAAVGLRSGASSFDAYPLVHLASGAATLALCAALAAAALLPFCDRRGIDP
jgi:energy-coupling factor transport system permease protein